MEKESGKCRFCGKQLLYTFVDLGMQPLCESYISPNQQNKMEPFYPLHVYVCDSCFLVQLEEYVSPKDIFSEYAYFSSYSDAWLAHAKNYVDKISSRLGLDANSLVLEIASNDGYLLQYFLLKGISVIGVEPAANVAEKALSKGIPTIVQFFDMKTAMELQVQQKKADLIIANNVLAQVPNINEFVASMKKVLKFSGTITVEFPHLKRLIEGNEFDTIYHEHFSYFSFIAVEQIFSTHDLTIYDVEELPTHGGSLRIYARHSEDDSKAVTENVDALRKYEISDGFRNLQKYLEFSEKVKETKRNLLSFIINLKRQGKSIVGYGAPGKGNTLLNYCGIRTDFLDYTVDRNPYKQAKFLPGSHIPIYSPDRIKETKPDYVLILPWNIKEEIVDQLSYIREWGGQFFVPIPKVTLLDARRKTESEV